jgi:hypothetical protein
VWRAPGVASILTRAGSRRGTFSGAWAAEAHFSDAQGWTRLRSARGRVWLPRQAARASLRKQMLRWGPRSLQHSGPKNDRHNFFCFNRFAAHSLHGRALGDIERSRVQVSQGATKLSWQARHKAPATRTDARAPRPFGLVEKALDF